MDSLAVSFASGLCLGKVRFRDAITIALTFGIFHIVMPLLGYLAGYSFHEYAKEWDHWIAFILLMFLGIRMIMDGLKERETNCFDPRRLKTRLSLALGTSIDAFAVGISFALLDMNIVMSCVIIGVTTAIISLFGIYAGQKINTKNLRVEIVGGTILIVIGIKILAEHLINNI